MKVRVFVPRALDPADGPTVSGTDHNFPMMPNVGHIVHFTDERASEFMVARVGFTQDGEAFLAAVWLEQAASIPVLYSDPIAEKAETEPYRDLNYDVPPESMTGY
jgi:hypothetical protein